MKQTAVEWLVKKLSYETSDGTIISHHFIINKLVEQAKEMEKKEKLKHQLFIGKVSDIIGFDKTLELLKECNNTIK
jgi:hypothetical protein